MSQSQRSRLSSSDQQGSVHRDNSPKRPHTPVRQPGNTSSRTEEGHSTITVDADLEKQIEETCDSVESLVDHHKERLAYWQKKREWLKNHAENKKHVKKSDLPELKRIENKASQENGTALLMLSNPNTIFDVR